MNSTYKFDEHLVRLSKSETPDEARKEWEFLKQVTISQVSERLTCICGNRNVKYFWIFFNIHNGNLISTGSECAKKLGLKQGQGFHIMNSNLRDFLINYQGIYTSISEILYSDEVRRVFMDFIRKRVDSSKTLMEGYNIVNPLVDKFKAYSCRFVELESLLDEIQTKITEEENKRIEQGKKDEQIRINKRQKRYLLEEKQREMMREARERRERRDREYRELEEQRNRELAEEAARLEREEDERKNKEKYQRIREAEQKRIKVQRKMALMREIREYSIQALRSI
jgi:hypothetical protein